MTTPQKALSKGTHYKGPLLGDSRKSGGLFENVPLGHIDRVMSRFKSNLETFDYPLASAATFAGSGCTLTDINTATSPTNVITAADPYLLINPGTKADSGSELQWNAAVSQATYITPAQRFLSPIVSTATLMDNRELIWACRFGIASNATTWDGKVIMGYFVTDTSLMSNTTGVPSVATGGGAGFHIGETGVFSFLGSQTAITAAGTSVGFSVATMDAADVFQWYEVGFRARWIDASAGTGQIKYYVNGRKVGTITSDLPFASTQTYSVTFGIHNGPSQLSDLAVDWVYTAITGAGRTNTSA